MTLSQVQGDHGGTEGLTVQDFIRLLQSLPRKVRESNYLIVMTEQGPKEVTGIHCSHHDQSEKHIFNVYVNRAA